MLEELTLTGLDRTSEEFVRDEIGFEAGCEVTIEDAQVAAQRLRNTNFFLSVKLFHEKISEESIRLHYFFEEKWTLTPVFRGGSGGGINFFVLGLYDINAMGAGIESGVQYEQYAGSPGLSVWWRDPHVGTRDWKIALDYTRVSRPVFYLHPQSKIYYSPLSQLHRFSMMGFRRFGNFEFGFGAEPLQRVLLSNELAPPEGFDDFSAPSSLGINLRSLLRFNSVNLDDFRLDGFRSELSAEMFLSERALQPQEPVLRFSAHNAFFRSFAERHSAALRLQGGLVSSGRLLELLRLGSLDGVRGALDGERLGCVAWAANAEYRYASFLSHWVVLQNVVFVDAGNAGVNLERWPLPLLASAGTGIRLGFRPIARLRLRADYALEIQGLRQSRSWVVGMQQYF